MCTPPSASTPPTAESFPTRQWRSCGGWPHIPRSRLLGKSVWTTTGRKILPMNFSRRCSTGSWTWRRSWGFLSSSTTGRLTRTVCKSSDSTPMSRGCTIAIPAVWRTQKHWSSWAGCCPSPESSPTRTPVNPWKSSSGFPWTASWLRRTPLILPRNPSAASATTQGRCIWSRKPLRG